MANPNNSESYAKKFNCALLIPLLLTYCTVPSFFAGVLCFSELFFIKEPHDVMVLRKDPVILDCQARGEVPVSMTWLKNGVKVTENERVYALSNGSLYIAEVENRRGDKSDEGFYQCLAQNKYGAILSQKARLTIASKLLKQGIWFFCFPNLCVTHSASVFVQLCTGLWTTNGI